MPNSSIPTTGFGATVSVDDSGNGGAAGGSVVALVNVVDLGCPAPEVGTVESKRLDLANATKFKIATLIDGGEVAISWELVNGNTTGNQYTRLETLRKTRAAHAWTFAFPCDAGTISVTVPAILTKNELKAVNAEEISMVETSIAVSGG